MTIAALMLRRQMFRARLKLAKVTWLRILVRQSLPSAARADLLRLRHRY